LGGTAVFSCRDIVKTYEGTPVVSGINLDLERGGLISLLGPSGAGKTTLFNVLAGVDQPDGGRIYLNGEDITGQSGRVSYMMQRDLLLEYRTALDNAILPLVIRGMKKKAARDYASSFFPAFGLGGCEKKYPRQLSGGMRQRAALLRACLQCAAPGPGGTAEARRGPVILLDEPFSALDALTRRTMRGWFQDIARSAASPLGSGNLSGVFITHDVEEALILSDRVYILTAKPGRPGPGTISAVFTIETKRPRGEEFSLTPEFAALKRRILAAIDQGRGPT
jgi:ABC-type nitrate/sulfonate/bicarbonate transport system ATPase subunit